MDGKGGVDSVGRTGVEMPAGGLPIVGVAGLEIVASGGLEIVGSGGLEIVGSGGMSSGMSD